MFLPILSKYLLAGLADRATGISMRDVSQGTQREIWAEFATELINEGLPHESPGCVIGEGEVNGLIEELFEVLLGTSIRLTGAADDSDAAALAYYQRMESAMNDKHASREAAHPLPLIHYAATNPDQVDGRRIASKKILSNRGLTRYRNNKFATPRTRTRHKYEKAVERHKSQVQKFKGAVVHPAAYGGEKTGIKATTVRSISLK